MNARISRFRLLAVFPLLLAAPAARAASVSFTVDVATTARVEMQAYHEDTIFWDKQPPPPPQLRFDGAGEPGIEVNGFSYGHTSQMNLAKVCFSVDQVAQGRPGSAVETEPNGEKASDIYKTSSVLGGTNWQSTTAMVRPPNPWRFRNRSAPMLTGSTCVRPALV